MKLHVLGATAFVMMATTMAQAAWDSEEIARHYTAQGYTRVEIELSRTQAKVEAIRGASKIEVIYDLATGKVLKTENETVDGDDSTAPGVFMRTDLRASFHDDLDSYDRSDDDDYHDHGDDDDHRGDRDRGRTSRDD